jgi:hypothetical protein
LGGYLKQNSENTGYFIIESIKMTLGRNSINKKWYYYYELSASTPYQDKKKGKEK